MIGRYQEIFQAQGSKNFAIAGLLARLALPMMGIGIITMLSQLKESYTLAGAVAATFVLTYALLSPWISRLVDKHGQFRILPIVAVISVIGIGVLLIATWLNLSDLWLFVGAFFAGFMPSMSAMVRARWSTIFKGQPILQTAYSLETVFDDVTFIAGPPISVGVSVGLFPQAGLLISAGLLITGVAFLVIQRSTEPDVLKYVGVKASEKSILRIVSLQLLIGLMISLGIIVGSVDILSVTLAEQQNQPAAASFVLSAYAVGSCFMGFIFGSLTLSIPLPRLLLISGLMTLLSITPLLLVDSIISLSIVVFISGLFFAPTMIIAMSLVEKITPPNRLTEGMTWLLAGLNIGVAAGAVLSGKMVDTFGINYGYLIAIGGGVLVLVTAIFSYFQLMLSHRSLSSLDRPTEIKKA